VAEFRRILPEYRTVGAEAGPDGTRKLVAGIEGDRGSSRRGTFAGTLVLLGLLVLTQCVRCPPSFASRDRPRHPPAVAPRDPRSAVPDELSRRRRTAAQILTTTHSPYLLDLFREQLER
jgi:hypothetical protein